MRIFFDTEFIEDGRTIDLISIGAVREDGATYYAESCEAELYRADDWVRKNVIAHLTGVTKSRAEIASDLIEFAGESPEFWAYYADYDWVVLCQLFGRMLDLPKGWPMFCRDIKQICADAGDHKLPGQTGTKHHALADAQWNMTAYQFLTRAKDDELTRLRGGEEEYRKALEDAGKWLSGQPQRSTCRATTLSELTASIEAALAPTNQKGDQDGGNSAT